MSEICERCQTVHLLRDALQRAVSVLRQEDECDSGRWGLSDRVAAEDLRDVEEDVSGGGCTPRGSPGALWPALKWSVRRLAGI